MQNNSEPLRLSVEVENCPNCPFFVYDSDRGRECAVSKNSVIYSYHKQRITEGSCPIKHGLVVTPYEEDYSAREE